MRVSYWQWCNPKFAAPFTRLHLERPRFGLEMRGTFFASWFGLLASCFGNVGYAVALIGLGWGLVYLFVGLVFLDCGVKWVGLSVELFGVGFGCGV